MRNQGYSERLQYKTANKKHGLGVVQACHLMTSDLPKI